MGARQLLEARNQVLRFDCEARVEVYITQGDLELECDWLRQDDRLLEEKVKEAKKVALRLAQEQVNSVHDVQLTADLSLTDINIDRIDWESLVLPEHEGPDMDDIT